MKRLLALSLICILFIGGCQGQKIAKDALILSPEALAQHQIQTRKYETKDEAKILTACAGLLQDIGFNLEASEPELGLFSASKIRTGHSTRQQVWAILAVLLGSPATYPTHESQMMRASIVTRPVGEQGEYTSVRVTFQRIVWNAYGEVTTSESLEDPQIYQEFFDKLSKAIFLEAQ